MFAELVAHDTYGFLTEQDLLPSPKPIQFKGQPPSRSARPETDVFEHYKGLVDDKVARYPLTKEEAGNAFWKVFHSHLAAYPNRKKISPLKRRNARIFIKEWLNAFPCDSCKYDAIEWVRNHRPQLRNRRTYAQWQEAFHNYVNRKTGKPYTRLEITDSAHDHESCPTCNLKAHDTGLTAEAKAELHATDTDGVAKHFDKIKEASKKVLYELADKRGIPRPNIAFTACPETPHGSCTIASINDGGNNSATIYLNPEQFSPRTLVHEFYHYDRAMNGDSKDFANEQEAEEFAMKVLNEHFDFDNGDSKKGEAAHDTRIKRMIAHQTEPAFVDNFDFIYRPFADEGKGVSSWMLSNAHTPEIIGYSLNAVEALTLSPLGMVIANVVSGAAFTGLGILSEGGIAPKDRQFLLELGAHQLWSFIPYTVNNQPLLQNAAQLGQSLARGDYGAAMGAFVAGGTVSKPAQVAKPVGEIKIESKPTPPPMASYTARRFSV